MPGSNITDVDAFTDPIVVVADGEAGNEANLKQGSQGNANRTRWLRNRTMPATAGSWIHVPLTPFSVSASAAAASSAGSCFVSQTSITGSALGTVNWAIPQFFGSKIIAVRLRLQGAGGHSNLPDTTMPQFVLWSVNTAASTPTPANIASANDTSANVAAYEAAHYITLSGLNLSYAPDVNYFASAQGEDGTGTTEILGLKFWGVQIQLAPV